MKAILQRSLSSCVEVDGVKISKIAYGYVVFLGVEEGDTEEDAQILAFKTCNLRMFEDKNKKINLSLLDIDGNALVISNFTLCADVKKGRRPSFVNAAKPDLARELYERYCEFLIKNGVKVVEKGAFGENMKVSVVNDGPATIILDTKEWI